MTKWINDAELSELGDAGCAYAIIDVRDEGVYSRAHLLRACSMPLRRLETGLAAHLELLQQKVVVCDDDGRSDAVEAARRMAGWGFADVSVLAAGLAGWRSNGRPIYSGVHTPSKAFGEAVEVAFATPSVTPLELVRRRSAGEPVFVIDCRPHAEYAKSSLPGSVNVPGFELPYRWSQVVPDPATPVVVHCAGRTRSIIGAQTLIEIGVPNPVAALENGTMGWLRAGFELVRPGRTPLGFDQDFRPSDETQRIAERIRATFSIGLADVDQVRQWRGQDPGRVTYLVDVRTLAEYEAGHPEGAMHAPGGQLIQATDKYLLLHKARVVVVDDDGFRASIAASWLKRMGWRDVHVWPIAGVSMPLCCGREPRGYFCSGGSASVMTVGVDELAELLNASGADVFDLDTSVEFERMHLPGSRFVERRHLRDAITAHPVGRVAVLASSDGVLAGICAAELPDPGRVRVLQGGKEAWAAAGHAVERGADSVPPDIDDVWRMPLEARGDRASNIDQYLSWEIGLTAQIRADSSVDFALPGHH